MQELSKLRKTKNSVLNKYKLNFPIASQVTYVTRSIRSFGPKIGNSVPYHVISAKNLGTFMKKIIGSSNGGFCLLTVLFESGKHFIKLHQVLFIVAHFVNCNVVIL